MMTPWVLPNPPRWLADCDVYYALGECGYDTYKLFCFDLRVPPGPVRDCIVIVPELVFDVWGWAGFTPDHENVRYADIHRREPHMDYRIAGLPLLPREVLDIALEFSRRRSRPTPPPTPWQRGLDFWAQARRLAP